MVVVPFRNHIVLIVVFLTLLFQSIIEGSNFAITVISIILSIVIPKIGQILTGWTGHFSYDCPNLSGVVGRLLREVSKNGDIDAIEDAKVVVSMSGR